MFLLSVHLLQVNKILEKYTELHCKYIQRLYIYEYTQKLGVIVINVYFSVFNNIIVASVNERVISSYSVK